jgi:hypothetical protein
MSFDMVYQMTLSNELLWTEFTFKVPLSIVTSQMHLKVPIFRETFAAKITFEWFNALMLSYVNF